MESKVTEITKDTYRISTFHPDFGIQFNQFLIDDEEPFLMHTGFRDMFRLTFNAVSSILDPKKLRWIGFSHFESDECGALNDFLHAAPQAQAVCSFVGAMVNVNDFATRPPRPLNDGDVVNTGVHRLRFVSTPQVPHGWDAGVFFDETEKTLFCSDLFFQPEDPEPLTETDIVGRAGEAIRANLGGPLAHDMPYTANTKGTLKRMSELDPTTLAVMHGSSFKGDGKAALVNLSNVIEDLLGKTGSVSLQDAA